MKKFFIFFILLCIVAKVNAQTKNENSTTDNIQDSTIAVIRPPLLDSTLTNISIFDFLENYNGLGNVTINQDNNITKAHSYYIDKNKKKKLNGYRIRIFFDSKQTARDKSAITEKDFIKNFPLIPTYRSYSNPFFKVVVGDYRTKTDAIKDLAFIKEQYPQAIIVKDNIEFPVL